MNPHCVFFPSYILVKCSKEYTGYSCYNSTIMFRLVVVRVGISQALFPIFLMNDERLLFPLETQGV